ncbi:MAG TPA: hypothetical protein DCR70_11560 [Phycisphaerales bacterium]|nr:hypothetical protein [Phycisphaerales bacterium]
MTDTAASTNAACSSSASCCCPCESRIKKLEKTVSRIRLWLFISLGVLIFLIGVAIGKGNGDDRDGREGRREEIRRVEIMGGPMMGGNMQGGNMQGGNMQGGPGPQHGPMMGGPGPRDDGMRGGPDRRPNMGGEGRGKDAPKQKKSGKDKD